MSLLQVRLEALAQQVRERDAVIAQKDSANRRQQLDHRSEEKRSESRHRHQVWPFRPPSLPLRAACV